MSSRRQRDSSSVFEERERDVYYTSDAPPPRRSREDVDIYERREERREERRAPSRGPPVREYEETDIRIRERERDRESRVPAFMRDDNGRRGDTTTGALVLRQRDVETVERPRPRPRSPSPIRIRERIVERERERERSPSPPPPPPMERDRIEIRDRIVERERSRVRSPSRGPAMERVRTRVVERERSPSLPPPPERIRTRIVERERERERSPSPSPPRRGDRERIRIIERERERAPSPSPSPPPPPPEPPIIRGPTIEREVITHYRDIDHGMIVARPPSPPPPAPRPRGKDRDTEIDIYTSRNRTEVDIHESSRERPERPFPSRGRSPSRERPSPVRRPQAVYDDEIVVQSDRNRLQVDIGEHRGGQRRAHSAAPPALDYDDEAEYITSRINERGRMGEAWNGHTKEWAIVDVPPGTERVRMDGVGGGGAEVTWQRYNGVRRAKFIPERSSGVFEESSSTTVVSDRELVVRDRDRDRDRDVRDVPRDRGERLSVQIYENSGKDRDRDIEIEKVTDRRLSVRSPAPPPMPLPQKRNEMWTEITKDLVVREAVEELGYEFEETEFFFYVMQYLRYEDVLELVQLSDQIKRERKDRVREIQWERDYRDDWERSARRRRGGGRSDKYEDERIVEREVIYDRNPPVRGYGGYR